MSDVLLIQEDDLSNVRFNKVLRKVDERGFRIVKISHPKFFGDMMTIIGPLKIDKGEFALTIEKTIYPNVKEFICDKCRFYSNNDDHEHCSYEKDSDGKYKICTGKFIFDEERTMAAREIQLNV